MPNDQPPKIGDYLHASCSGEDYGRVIAVGKDGNGTPTIDIEVFTPDDMMSFGENNGTDFSNPVLTRVEIPAGVKVILRDLQWRQTKGYEGWDADKTWVSLIICNTPGNQCFRCTKLFSLRREKSNR